jgi:glycerophosphoryl diester phosphodiesterase
MKNRLVAHRGDMTAYPENSLLALRAAAELGLINIELDIQLSKDLKPIIIHDENLVRTTGIEKSVFQATADELAAHRVITSVQNSESKNLLHIARLKQAVELLNNYPDITLFVEIKRQSIEYFDLKTVVNSTIKDLEHANFNVVIISFVKEVVEYVQQKSNYPSGWVLKKYDQSHHDIVNSIQAEYLFCNVKKINKPNDLWQGVWKWVLYDIKNPSFAYELLEQGVDLIETGDIMRLSNSEYFQ